LEGFFCDFVEFVGHLRRKETNFAQFYNFNKEVTAVSGVIPSSD